MNLPSSPLDRLGKFARPSIRKFTLAGLGVTAAFLALLAEPFPVKGQQSAPAPAAVDSSKPTAAPSLFKAPASEAVVDAATAFFALLTPAQQATVRVDLAQANAGRWSNLPAGIVARNGLYFRDLNPEQVKAALDVARVALSAEGFQRFQELRAADDEFGKSHGAGGPGRRGPGGPNDRGPGGPAAPGAGGPGPNPTDAGAGQPAPGGPPPGGPRGPGGGKVLFGSGNYIIAFLGQPSKTKPWLLQLGGHHLAFNLYYKGAAGASTPYFLGVQPNIWKDADGKTHAPLAPMRDTMVDLFHSVTPEQLAQARLEARFSDVYVGPGKDARFPARSEGIPVAQLSPASQELVKKAIAAWAGDSIQAADYRKLYESELDQTKVAWSGSIEFSKEGDYARIDGPHLWIEFACQGSDHYHTIWRDRTTDYGAEFLN